MVASDIGIRITFKEVRSDCRFAVLAKISAAIPEKVYQLKTHSGIGIRSVGIRSINMITG